MAKGSVRKKGKKWYYRFYIENESGNLVQKEFPGTESKSETEAMLRRAMEDYENKMFLAQAKNTTLGDLLDQWIEEEVKPGNLSNGTVSAYQSTVERVKKHPISERKLKKIKTEHLQAYFDFLSFGGTYPNGDVQKALAMGSMRAYSAVFRGAFRFAVFPKMLLSFDPMPYVVVRTEQEDSEIFASDDTETPVVQTIGHDEYLLLKDFLSKKKNPALLPIQIAYYTGMRIGEACGLAWQDINLEGQYLTVRRSIRYNNTRRKWEIGTTKRKKVRTIDFCDTLAAILRAAKRTQQLNRFQYGELYRLNYYKPVKEKNRTYYEVYHLPRPEQPPEDYCEIDLVCVRPDGSFESPSAVSIMCRAARKKIAVLDDDFHFHTLRHTYTSNLLANGAAPKDVQELLGHSDVSTTMNIYAHSSRESRKATARLLDTAVAVK